MLPKPPPVSALLQDKSLVVPLPWQLLLFTPYDGGITLLVPETLSRELNSDEALYEW